MSTDKTSTGNDMLSASRRQFLKYGAALPLAGLALGMPTFSYAEDPVRGGTITMALTSEPPVLLTLAHSSGYAVYISGKVCEGLLTYDFDLNPMPELATSWEMSPDGLTYTFKLREGVKFHDGTDFTSADVVKSISISKEFHPRGRSTFANVTAITAPDPLTAVLTLSKPAPYLITALAASEVPMIPAHLYETGNPPENPCASAPVGTGPYVFKTWERGSHVILERNPAYWDPSKPYIDTFVIRFITDQSALAAAMESGDVQLGTNTPVPLSDLERLKSVPTLAFETKGYAYVNAITRLEFNLDNPYFKDVKVRQGIAHATDKDFIANTIFFGYAKPIPGPISPYLTKFYVPELPAYPFDLAKAEALLDEAGFPKGSDGTRFKVRLDFIPGGQQYNRMADYFRQTLGKIGIDVTIRTQDYAAYAKTVYTDRDFDFQISGISNLFDPTVGVQRLYWSKNFKPGVPFSNGSHYENPKVDELLEQASVEVDTAKRLAMFAEFQKIVAEELPDMGLVAPDAITIYDTRVMDHTTTGDGLQAVNSLIYLKAQA